MFSPITRSSSKRLLLQILERTARIAVALALTLIGLCIVLPMFLWKNRRGLPGPAGFTYMGIQAMVKSLVSAPWHV